AQHVPGDQRPDENHRAQNHRPRPTTGPPTTAVPAATDGTPPPVAYPHPAAAVEAAPVGTTYDADDSPAGRLARPR
ncbi:hypothetical protein ACWD9K_31375, partial [Streptomyces sp. 900116325]